MKNFYPEKKLRPYTFLCLYWHHDVAEVLQEDWNKSSLLYITVYPMPLFPLPLWNIYSSDSRALPSQLSHCPYGGWGAPHKEHATTLSPKISCQIWHFSVNHILKQLPSSRLNVSHHPLWTNLLLLLLWYFMECTAPRLWTWRGGQKYNPRPTLQFWLILPHSLSRALHVTCQGDNILLILTTHILEATCIFGKFGFKSGISYSYY